MGNGRNPITGLSCAEATDVVGCHSRDSLSRNVLAMAALRRHGEKTQVHETGCVFSDPNHWVVRLLAESQPQQ